MKANELMLGDFVTFKDCQNDKDMVVIKIWDINQEGNAFVFIDDSEVLDEVFIDEDFVGIPLTPEILEKNGFKEYNGYGYAGNKGYCFKGFYINHDFFIKIANIDCKVNFIHELQHALKLCGIKKTIEL